VKEPAKAARQAPRAAEAFAYLAYGRARNGP